MLMCTYAFDSISVHAFLFGFIDILDFRVLYRLLISRLSLLVNAFTRMPESHHLIMYMCVCLCTLFGFILRTRWVAF